jgi:hypothetical protein
MPVPRKGEKRKDFVDRCIPIVIDEGTAKDPKQAVAICNSMWENRDMKNSTKYKNTVLLQETATIEDAGVLTGTVFYKQIVAYGKWVNPLFPVEFMELDEEFGKSLLKNFESGVVGKIPVPLDHTDQVDRNAGEVIKLELKPDGVYAYIDIRRQEVVDDILGGLIFDVSISFDWNYVDTKDGKEYGPTLLHVALVNNPYLKGMTPFSEFLEEFSNKTSKALALSNTSNAIMLSESKVKELQMETATVKNDRDFPVDIVVKDEDGEEVTRTLQPGEETEVPKDQAEAVTTSIADATNPDEGAGGEGEGEGEGSGSGEGEGGEGGSGEGAGGEGEEGKDKNELADLRKKNAALETEKAYNTLLSEGKITPAQKDKFMQLAQVHNHTVNLSGKQVSLSSIVTEILQAGPQVVKFSEDGSGKGKEGAGDGEDKKPSEDLSDEERAGFEAVGTDPKTLDKMAEKYPHLVKAALSNDVKKEGK